MLQMALIVYPGGYCGIGYLSSGQSTAFTVTSASCATGYYSLYVFGDSHQIVTAVVIKTDRSALHATAALLLLGCLQTLAVFREGFWLMMAKWAFGHR